MTAHEGTECQPDISDCPWLDMQVQDVGLIFLSAMASSIALLCEQDGYEPREALGTSLLTLAISTFIVGILIVGEHYCCGTTAPSLSALAHTSTDDTDVSGRG